MEHERPSSKNAEQEEVKAETQRERSEQEIEEIHMKIDEIARITPPEYQDVVLSFLEYWLS